MISNKSNRPSVAFSSKEISSILLQFCMMTLDFNVATKLLKLQNAFQRTFIFKETKNTLRIGLTLFQLVYSRLLLNQYFVVRQKFLAKPKKKKNLQI